MLKLKLFSDASDGQVGAPVSERGLFHFSKNSPVGPRNRLDFERNNSGGQTFAWPERVGV